MALLIPSAVFFHLPKTGGTWIRQVLHPFRIKELGHVHAVPSDVCVPQGSLTFCFVRSPWTWLPSVWAYKRSTDPQWSRWDALRVALGGSDTFAEFVERYLTNVPGHYSFLCRRMVEGCTCVGLFERLEADLREIVGRCGLALPKQLPPPILRSPPSLLSQCRWTRDLAARVRDCDRWVFETFGFPDLPHLEN